MRAPVATLRYWRGHVMAWLCDQGDGLRFTLDGAPTGRSAFEHRWRPVARAAGFDETTGMGMHALRHYYASLLIRYGESITTVGARLAQASASETLDTYSHIGPTPTTAPARPSTPS